MIQFKLAEKEQVEELVRISKAAFESDIQVGNTGVGGPPGYDSADWHHQMQESGHLYVLLDDETILGGAVLFQDAENPCMIHIDRIFVAPQYHRKGYGIRLMEEITRVFERPCLFQLDTPIWNIRTSAFYQKCGFQEISRSIEFIHFKKNPGKLVLESGKGCPF